MNIIIFVFSINMKSITGVYTMYHNNTFITRIKVKKTSQVYQLIIDDEHTLYCKTKKALLLFFSMQFDFDCDYNFSDSDEILFSLQNTDSIESNYEQCVNKFITMIDNFTFE